MPYGPDEYPSYCELPPERRAKAEQSLREFKVSELALDVAMERLWNILVHPDVYEPTL